MDSRDKRASAIGLGLAALLVLPEPGTIDQPDRQQVAYSYRGIQALPSDAVAAEPTWSITVAAQVRSITVPAQIRTITVPAPTRRTEV